ncbi:hypothetical protein EON64_02675 [archaeon]|nr:MAG: hypothetical protein EON64_02675 [archaeon]
MFRSKGRIVRTSQDLDDDDNEPGESQHRRSKRKAATASLDQPIVSRRREALVDTQFIISQSKATGVDGQLFKNQTYCVPENEFVTSSGVKYTRQEIIDYICRQQGHIVASSSYPNCQVIAGNKRTVQLKNIIAQGKNDVIDFGYIIDCLEANFRIPIRAYDFLGCSAETRKLLSADYDVYGDSYVEPVTPSILLKIVSAVDSAALRSEGKDCSSKALSGKSWRLIAHTELEDEEEEELISSHMSTCMYRHSIIIYIDMYASLGALTIPEASLHTPNSLYFDPKVMRSDLSPSEINTLRALAARLYARGALLASCLHTRVSHVVFVRADKKDLNRRIAAIHVVCISISCAVRFCLYNLFLCFHPGPLHKLAVAAGAVYQQALGQSALAGRMS